MFHGSHTEDGGAPLYAQLEEVVRERIESGTWPVGTRLPSERDLCDEFGLSRATTRRALERLEKAGWVKTVPRRGTVVRAQKAQLQALSLQSFSDQILAAGASPTSKLIRFETVLPPQPIRNQLGLNPDQLVLSLERLRRADGEPVALHHSFLPVHVAPGLEEADLTERSLYTILDERYGVRVAHASETLQSTLATNYESEVLDVPPGAPMLQLSIRLTTESGQPVEYVRATLRGDKVSLTSQI